MRTPPSCNPREISLKSMFLGPQAENGPWVQKQVNQVFLRWFEWRRKSFPSDGPAISIEDQGTQEFVEREQVFSQAVNEILDRFERETPKFSPRYIGHMLSEISLPALFGHIVALLHNPNNISGESSRIGVKIEDEAVEALLNMVGYSPQLGTGHFTSGGTVANFEALIRARARSSLWLALGCKVGKALDPGKSLFEFAHMGWKAFDELVRKSGKHPFPFHDLSPWNFTEGNPWEVAHRYNQLFGLSSTTGEIYSGFKGPIVLVPENKHYSWPKGVSILGLGDEAFWPIAVNERGSLCLLSLKEKLEKARHEQRPVIMVVSVAGSTEMGAIDPLDEVQALLDLWKSQYGIHIWHHVDAAYGGFFCTLDENDADLVPAEMKNALNAISRSDSVTIDPHKLGYVPYSSGTFLTQLKRDYFVKGISAPYIQYEKAQDKGPFTLEGSRSAAGAVATWMTAKTIGLNREGYGRILARTIRTRKSLAARIQESGLSLPLAPFSNTNVLCFSTARSNEKLSLSNQRTERLYRLFSPEGNGAFFVSKTRLGWKSYGKYLDRFVQSWNAQVDVDDLVLIRVCIMNPFFGSNEFKIDYEKEFLIALKAALQTLG